MNTLEKIYVALDNMTKEEVFAFLEKPENNLPNVKIGLELFTKYGPELIKEIKHKFDKDIFLDLKLHDIPNTVSKSIKSLEGLPIKLLTIHLSGGRGMLLAAKEAQEKYLPDTSLLGVSYLTSLGGEDFKEMWGFEENKIQDAFNNLFKLAIDCKIGGVVCSAHEASQISSLEDNEQKLIKLCPGIRFNDEISSGQQSDQKRVLGPLEAFKQGADLLVIGRSLTQAKSLKDRIQTLNAISL